MLEAPPALAQRQGEHVLYTWTAQNAAAPMEIISGEGAHFVTADGARWLDLGSMVWNANLGHGRQLRRWRRRRRRAHGYGWHGRRHEHARNERRTRNGHSSGR